MGAGGRTALVDQPARLFGPGRCSDAVWRLGVDYAISTIDNNPLNINFLANYEMIGIGSFVFAQDYFRGTEGVTHYQDVYVFDADIDTVSTYVSDFGNSNRNYAFLISDVPEPASWALMIAGFGMVGFAMRRRQVALTA